MSSPANGDLKARAQALPPVERTPSAPGAGPGDETPELVNRVREARLQAGEARQQASRILARISRTTVRVSSTQRQAVRARERRRQLAASRDGTSRVIGDRIIRPSASPVSALPDLTAQDRFDSSPATLRRAVAFIDEHAGCHLTVADIAAASFVTVRAVQLAFRRTGNDSDEYLRGVRLNRFHQDLVAADAACESVTAVAYRWKFASASRFTAYYRSTYGVLPSHTLRS